MSVPCLRFGMNGHTKDWNSSNSVVPSYTRRASYEFLDDFDNFSAGESASEMAVRHWSTTAGLFKHSARVSDKIKAVYGSQLTHQACLESPSLCARAVGLRKGVYFPNGTNSQSIFPNSSSTHPFGDPGRNFATIHGPGPGTLAVQGGVDVAVLMWRAS